MWCKTRVKENKIHYPSMECTQKTSLTVDEKNSNSSESK